MIRVVVVDDEPMVCAHLRTILGSSGDIEVVDEAHDGAAGVEAVVRSRPDLVLMDLRMPGVDGLTAIGRIGKLTDPPVVVVLTTFDADQYVLRALRAGAAGFLVKSTPPADLIGLVRVAADGHTVLSLSEATVKGYVSRMLVKLGCANRTQAGLLAHDAGIVTQ
jgi:DNA-binding NarL/FixJ family response regulator